MASRIQVVEDENIVAKDLAGRLTSLGYEVTGIAGTGEDAIAKALSDRPDLVLMDVRLRGEMDGVQAAEKIRDELGTAVVFLTAYSDDETLSRAKHTEPYGYLLKPFEERELRTTIEIALHRNKMEKKLRANEQWLATTLRSIGDAVLATDTEGKITFMNPVAESLTGWSFEQASGRMLADVFNLVNKETRKPSGDLVSLVLRDGMPMASREEHVVLIARGGMETPIDDCAAPIRDDKMHITGVVLVFRDVTERRLAEQILRQHADYLRKRIKELNCFYTICRILQKPDMTQEELLTKIVQTLPGAWQYPDDTYAAIDVCGQRYATENYQPTAWVQSAEVLSAGVMVGHIDVGYLREKHESYEGPFLKEERNLLNSVAIWVGNLVEMYRMKEVLSVLGRDPTLAAMVHTTSNDLSGLMAEVSSAVHRSDGGTRLH